MGKTEDNFCILDTNVLIYAINSDSVHHDKTRKALDSLQNKHFRFCVTEQIIRETLVVATQSRFLSHPLNPLEAKKLATQLLYKFVFLPSNNYSRLCLLELISQYKITGRLIHDANIIAVMQSHGVKHLFTYNIKDFSHFRGISLIDLP